MRTEKFLAAGHGWLPYQTPVPFTRLPAPEPVPPAPAYTMLPPVAPESENQVHRLPPPAYHLQQAPGASPENATYRLPAP